MNETMSFLLATTILDIGGLGFMMYKSTADTSSADAVGEGKKKKIVYNDDDDVLLSDDDDVDVDDVRSSLEEK